MKDDRIISPYQGLEPRAFWRSGLVEAGQFPPLDLYRPKFVVTRDQPVMTAGSCFAQHVGKALRGAGFNVIDAEPAPGTVSDALAQQYGYGLYSARYGNIYTVRQLLQLLLECAGQYQPADAVWEKDGRFFDAMRPGVEPTGHDSAHQVREARTAHLTAVAKALSEAQVLIFTLGLTEAWEHGPTGTIYPTAPGTIAGRMTPDFAYRNFRHAEIRDDFDSVRRLLHAINPAMRFVLTVSPVPLTATASGDHVLSATTYSKSVLRGVAGELAQDYADVDYFPSYEIVTAPISRGAMYEPNMRSVRSDGVAKVMQTFLHAMGAAPPPAPTKTVQQLRAERRARRQNPLPDVGPANETESETENDVICEEALLAAFEKK